LGSGDPFVIVGCGQAAGWAARTLRQEGHAQPIVMIGDEPHPPYERPPLSKAVLLGKAAPESTYLFPGSAWDGLGIEHLPGAKANRIEPDKRNAGRIEGAVGMNSGRDLKFVRRLMQARVVVDPERISDPSVRLQDLLKTAT
jgi:hypothetical protein